MRAEPPAWSVGSELTPNSNIPSANRWLLSLPAHVGFQRRDGWPPLGTLGAVTHGGRGTTKGWPWTSQAGPSEPRPWAGCLPAWQFLLAPLSPGAKNSLWHPCSQPSSPLRILALYGPWSSASFWLLLAMKALGYLGRGCSRTWAGPMRPEGGHWSSHSAQWFSSQLHREGVSRILGWQERRTREGGRQVGEEGGETSSQKGG